MRWKNAISTGICLVAPAILLGPHALAADTAGQYIKSRQVTTLLRDLKEDATQVEMAAERLQALTTARRPEWRDFDRQWNEIKPQVEGMQIHLARLSALAKSEYPGVEPKLDQMRPAVSAIQAQTRSFYKLLNQSGVRLESPKYKTCASTLKTQAIKLERVASESAKETS